MELTHSHGLEISLLHVRGTSIGYARMGTYIHRELNGMGVDVYDQLEAATAGQADHVRHLLEEAHGDTGEFGPRRHKQTNVVCWLSVPTHARGWWEGQYAGCFTMFEATIIPESFRETLHNFDVVMVPSEQNQEVFSRFCSNVVKVPLGVDLLVWYYRERRPPTSRFNFLIGGSGARKGTDIALKAFKLAFPEPWRAAHRESPEPWLVMKSPKVQDFHHPYLLQVNGRLTDEAEVDLYASAHCYVQPSRGEGFGLQPLQAMAQGIPTILTDAHGHADFAWLGMGVSSKMVPAEYFIYGPAGEWWEPDLDEIVDHMRETYENYEHACHMAQISAGIVAREWGWHHTAERFLSALGRERLRTPYAGNGQWYKPSMKLYHVRVDKPWQADIAGELYQFTPGTDYFEPADVKRILFEGDVLDPGCLTGAIDGDLGLLPEQAEQIGLYSARHSYCRTCNQRLGSGITRADEIYAEMQSDALS